MHAHDTQTTTAIEEDPSDDGTTGRRLAENLPEPELVWAAISEHVSQRSVVRHQIESFNTFINYTLKTIISENSDVTSVSSDGKASWHLQFTNVCVHKPTSREAEGFEFPLMPHAARLRGLTYSSSVCVDICHDKVDRRGSTPVTVWRKVYRSVVLCRIPIMLGSDVCYLNDASKRDNECIIDRGAMFVVNGHEKVLLCQEKMRCNVPFVFSGKGTKYGLVCEVRSCHELKLRSTSTITMMTTSPAGGGLPSIVCKLPFLQTTIPLPTLFRLLGATCRDDAMNYIPIPADEPLMEHIVRSVFDGDEHADTTQEQAFEWMGREATREVTRERRSKYCLHILGNELLPHVGLRVDHLCNQRKLHYLGFMVARLLRVHLGKDPLDDRDDYSNKRVDSAGVLMSLLMRQLYRAYLKSVSVLQHRLVENGKIDSTSFGDLITDKRITSGFKYAMATGVWNAQKNGLSSQNGVAQVMSRMTALSAQSNLRRVNTPISRDGKCPKPRQLHPSSYGIICPSESPEGSGCGLVKNLALNTIIRCGVYSTPIAECILRAMKVKVIPLLTSSKKERNQSTMIFVNGVTIGFVDNECANELIVELRKKRRRQELPYDMSVTIQGQFIHVSSDPGGLCRPVIIRSEVHRFNDVCRHAPAYINKWEALMSAGVIEYVDKAEEATLRIAVRPSDILGEDGATFTHIELDPCLMLGIMASLIPFANNDQAPRVTYQAAMGKQACGWYCTSWPRRMDSVAHVQMYPMIPIVSTRFEQILRVDHVPSGANVLVCICAFGGYNQEDSLIINKSSVQRGLFRTICHRTVKDEEKAGADAERFENPTTVRDCANIRVGSYDKLNGDFVVPPGTTVKLNDCLVAKTISTADVAEHGETRTTIKRDKSTMQRHNEEAVVDMVLHTKTRDGNRAVKVRTRSIRIPVVGDKFSSRHGQKGICGQLCEEEEMPYCPRTGMRPDIIVNPHAIPSRMTIGQLVEQLLSILCCHEAEIGDGTPFRGVTPQAIGDALEEVGLQREGNRMMVDGQTGEHMPMLSFFGPVYYQRLKHMVVDKMHARSRGPCQILTRQPLEGRAHMGGLRFGEMERDTLIAHGCAAVLLEFLLLKSDAFRALVCTNCGLLAIPAGENAHVRNAQATCHACGSTKCVYKTMPYAMKLLMQELMGMNIAPRLRLDQSDSPACEMASKAI